MASNASDNSQTNTLILFTVRSDPITPIDLQRASDYSLNSNTDTSTTNFQLEEYADIDWKRFLSYYLSHLTSGRRRGPT